MSQTSSEKYPPTPGDGPVTFHYPPDLTEEEKEQMRRYVDSSNEARVLGKLSETGRVGTKGSLRRQATRAAKEERLRAEAAGTPYQYTVGHVPDTTWTGRPVGHEWHDQTQRVNGSLGGEASQYPVGFKPTEFRLEAEAEGADLPPHLAAAKLAETSQGRPPAAATAGPVHHDHQPRTSSHRGRNPTGSPGRGD